jgi:nucleotide-binding universal stress UspA family protein
MLLIAYDGSEDARAAIDAAARLTPGGEVTILCVWEPLASLVTRNTFGPGYASYVPDADELDTASRAGAEERAEEGVGLAQEAGLQASALTRPLVSTAADAIIEAGEQLHADAIVMGTRGRTGIKSALLGSVSQAVVQHAYRPVVIAPSAPVVEARRKHHAH